MCGGLGVMTTHLSAAGYSNHLHGGLLEGTPVQDPGIAWVFNWQQIVWLQKEQMLFIFSLVSWLHIATSTKNKSKCSGLILLQWWHHHHHCSVLTRQWCCQPIHPLNKRPSWRCFSRTNEFYVHKYNMTQLRSLSRNATHDHSFIFIIVRVLI